MKEQIKMLYPSYIKEFKCIGGSCGDSCCNGWEIYIDKDTFRQYEGIQNERMKEFINKNIFIRSNCNNISIDYGQIKLENGKECPFLDSDKYCSIQSRLGEKYLSKVCTTFPRVINKIDDYYEISLDVSCLEAARILLSKEEGIKFEESENTLDLNKHNLSMKIDTCGAELNYTNFKYIKEIRNKSIMIIKNRNYELSERLYILGCFLETIRKELCYNYDNVNQAVESYNINSFCGKFKRDKTNYMLQLSFYRDMLEKLNVFEDNKSEYFRTKTKEVMTGLRFNEHKSLIENERLYLEGYDLCEKNVIRKYSYIFENYIVNHMFNELFPFSESDVLIRGYIMLLVRFAYVKFYLVGQYLYNGDTSKENIIRVIQSLSKEIEHDKDYLKDVLKYIVENELDNMSFAKILL